LVDGGEVNINEQSLTNIPSDKDIINNDIFPEQSDSNDGFDIFVPKQNDNNENAREDENNEDIYGIPDPKQSNNGEGIYNITAPKDGDNNEDIYNDVIDITAPRQGDNYGDIDRISPDNTTQKIEENNDHESEDNNDVYDITTKQNGDKDEDIYDITTKQNGDKDEDIYDITTKQNGDKDEDIYDITTKQNGDKNEDIYDITSPNDDWGINDHEDSKKTTNNTAVKFDVADLSDDDFLNPKSSKEENTETNKKDYWEDDGDIDTLFGKKTNTGLNVFDEPAKKTIQDKKDSSSSLSDDIFNF